MLNENNLESLKEGTVFSYKGKRLVAIPSPKHSKPCSRCFFPNTLGKKDSICGKCFAHKRADHTSVIFIKEENLCMYHF